MSEVQSLESFIELKNSHCFYYLKEDEKILSKKRINGIKRTLTSRLERKLTDDEHKVFSVFTGLKKRTLINGISIGIGNVTRGMMHVLTRHFRENGDKYGGRVEYIDMILIAEILLNSTPVQQKENKSRYKYTYTNWNGKNFILITSKYKENFSFHTFYSDDVS